MSAWAIIVAAGEGRRFGGPKAFVRLGPIPLVMHSLEALSAAKGVDEVVLVLAPEAQRTARETLGMQSYPVSIVTGGATRQASVAAGLERVPVDVDRVVVHDGARPLVTPELVEAVLAALDHAAGAVAAIAEGDTLKRVSDERVVESVSREGLWRAQTPQAFRTDLLRTAHARAAEDGFEATDDAMLVERLGETIVIVPGDESNLKVTTPQDLAIAEALIAAREER